MPGEGTACARNDQAVPSLTLSRPVITLASHMLNALRSVSRIITHANTDGPCPDGIAAALVLRDALGPLPVSFINYSTPAHRELVAEPGLLFCDMTPPRERVAEFVTAGAIVLDHHAGAADIVAAFGERGVYSAEPGVCGAVLAFREVWSPLAGHASSSARISDFATLAGIRDTWQREDPLWRDACAQAAALCFWPWETLVRKCGGPLIDWEHLREAMTIGETLLLRDEERARRQFAEGRVWVHSTREPVTYDLGLLNCLAFNGSSHDTSNVADIADGIDLVLGFTYEATHGAPEMVVHLRSRSGFDCAALAKRHGGGGHRGAAGFRVRVAKSWDPYTVLDALVRDAHA